MSTKSTRSSGTQHTKRGVNQGVVLVDPITGLPVDVHLDNAGTNRLCVDANITVDEVTVDTRELDATTDNVGIRDETSGNQLNINNDGSIDANVEVDAADGDNIAIHDSSGNELIVNPDGSINVTASPLTSPMIVNQVAVLSDTEYSYTFPTDTKKISLRARGQAKLKLAFVSGSSGTNFITIFPGSKYEEIGLKLTSITAYFQSNKAGETVEILSWT